MLEWFGAEDGCGDEAGFADGGGELRCWCCECGHEVVEELECCELGLSELGVECSDGVVGEGGGGGGVHVRYRERSWRSASRALRV